LDGIAEEGKSAGEPELLHEEDPSIAAA